MNDGRILKGGVGTLAQIDETPADAERLRDRARPIYAVNDGLRRVFVAKNRVVRNAINPANIMEESLERVRIPRTPNEVGRDQGRIPPFLSYYPYEPFDEFGRRIVIVTGMTQTGQILPVPVEQTITEINPRYVVVASRGMAWDMRIATSSLPRSVITRILMNRINPKNLEQRKSIVRFYIQSERYSEASAELAAILEDFGSDQHGSPEYRDVTQDLQPLQRSIGRLETEQFQNELILRRNAGQYEFVKPFLEDFPTEQADVETLQAVRNMIEEDLQYEQWRTRLLATLYDYAGQIEEEQLREMIPPILDEINTELTQNTITRFSPLQLMIDDDAMPVDEKLAMAVSGWLVGENEAVMSLPMAVSMHKTRENVRQYLTSDTSSERERLLQKIESEETGTIEDIVKILPMMKPVYPIPRQPDVDKPGFYRLETPAIGNLMPFSYCIQLPPEYDPNRKYPLIIALHAGIMSPEQQIDWWAGEWRNGQRTGQATRNGYIVVAPYWNVNGSVVYDYSAVAHGAVLYSYYDVLRHFSVDVDRVYLTGHSAGGDAAWDIGISHPDLWAGVMPIVASSRKYIRYYPLNARYVPWYFVIGELDGTVSRTQNDFNFNKYLMASNAENYRCTVVSYIGRGHEGFSDEILHLFDWMGRQKREFPIKNFEVNSLRPWDNFFWWVEGHQFPPSAMIDPADWPESGGLPATAAKARLEANITRNRVQVKSVAAQTTVWLSPELIDFNQRVEVQFNGRRTSADGLIEGKLTDLLEDVRTRHDRQHPFWVKFTF